MFGMGGTEILVILVIALLFLGPEKLPEAAKQISKGIRDLRRQTRDLQNTIENDSHLGGAIRDIKSALRGDEAPKVRPPVRKAPPVEPVAAAVAGAALPAAPAAEPTTPAVEPVAAAPAVTLPESAGEQAPDDEQEPGDAEAEPAGRDDDLARLIRPATGTVAKGAAVAEQDDKAS